MGEALKYSYFAVFVATLAGSVDSHAKLPEVPSVFCAEALSIAETTGSCGANRLFEEAAHACMEKLNRLEASFAADLNSIASAGGNGQRGETKKGGKEYNFASNVMVYLGAVGRVAANQAREYQHYVVLPPDEQVGGGDPEDPFGSALGVPCFGGTLDRLAEAEEDFERKIATYAARKNEADAHEAKLRGRDTNYSSLQGKVESGAQRTGSTKRALSRAKSKDSKISGVELDKAKRKNVGK